MKKGSLMLIPAGGIANRMQAIASAYQLVLETGIQWQVIWFKDWALNAPFYSIFKSTIFLPIREAKNLDFVLYDRARQRNFFLPALPQKLLFESRIKEQEITPLKKQGFDFLNWAHGHRCYMSSYQTFINTPDKLYATLFHPVDEIMNKVQHNIDIFSPHTFGLHIRRTDHVESIRKSPTYLFIEKIKEEIDTHMDARFYLATDSNKVKEELLNKFGDRIITPQEEARRDNIAGIQGGVIDLWCLAATCKIYGSSGSTFSSMASRIGSTPIEIVSK
ncbi:MAG: hypothetical protein K5856_00490 [Bacteroidaceae bacterium]|nr:hypothetical protein [Bacteroidaceae bacterium]